MLNDIKKALALVFLIIFAVEQETREPGAGAAKKAEVQKRMQECLDPLLPDWLNPVILGVSGMLIDALVALANRTGFFGWFAATSNT